jgi:exodeoxyribonuclease V beta subunit
MGETEVMAPLRWLGDDQAIAARVLPEKVPPKTTGGAARDVAELQPVRIWSRHLTLTSIIRSFSSLHQQEETERELPDHDAGFSGSEGSLPVAPPRSGPQDKSARSIFNFPRGMRAGSCLHAILEILDFAEPQPRKVADLVEKQLRLFGIDPAWTATTVAWIGDILHTPLDHRLPDLRLAALHRRHRLDELEFYYSMPPLGAASLRRMFSGSLAERTEEEWEQHDQSTIHFMKGFMDLVFCFQDRFYIVDYKSNHLGDDFTDYGRPQLDRAMREAGYDMQYHIYCVALHRYLGLRLADYDYDRHMGGVYYLFLRGMKPEHGDSCGIFQDRPDRILVERLDRMLTMEIK